VTAVSRLRLSLGWVIAMPKKKVTSFTITGRFLVASAVFLFALLVAAAAVTNTMGLDARNRLTAATAQSDTRAASAAAIDGLLGRAGFTGQLLGYAASAASGDLGAMELVLDDAAAEADRFLAFGSEPFAREFLDITRGRIAQGRLALTTLSAGERNAATIAVDFAADLSSFDVAYNEFSAAEQRLQTRDALQVLTLQRWITSLALGAAVFIMGLGALLLHLNVRRPLRKLAESLEELLTDEEECTLSETDRDDEIGMVARVAEDLRRTQLQAGRLLTLGADGALRLRLEGEGAEAVDAALKDISIAVDDLRGSARTLSESGEGIAGENREVMARVENALDETVAETAGRLGTLAEAGEEVLRLAGDLEGTRRSLAGTESDWRLEMSELAETMRAELERLRATSEHLSESTATAGARVSHVSGELTDIASSWRAEQHALNTSSERTREELGERLTALDGQINNLDGALGALQALTTRAAPPIENAAGAISKAAGDLGEAGKVASQATLLIAKEAQAARNARLSVMSEAEADRAHWQTERGALRKQAGEMIAELSSTAARVDELARELNGGADGIPGKLDRASQEITTLSAQIKAFERAGGQVAGQLGDRLSAVQNVLGDAQAAFVDEANVMRSVTADLSDMHLGFEKERRAVSDQVGSLAETLERLDSQLQTINERVESPLDLSPVLGALRNEMGQAVTHLTRAVEDQTLAGQRTLSNAVYQIGQKIEGQSGSFEHLIATGLLDLSDRLNRKITAQNEAAGKLADILGDLQSRLTHLPDLAIEGDARIVSQADVSALVDPRIDRLDETAREMVFELRALAKTVSEQRNVRVPQSLEEQMVRIESLQGNLGEAQQAIALALRDGLKNIAHRLRGADVSGVRHQIDEVMETLVRHQDRLSGIMRDMSSDMKTRIDGLSGQIVRGGKLPPPRKGIFNRPSKASLPEQASTEVRVSQTPPPEENELSAIHDALRGLTEELKGLSADDGSSSAESALTQRDVG